MRSSLKPLRVLVPLLIFALVALPATASAPTASDQSLWLATLPPALDGDLTDWSGVPPLVLDQDSHSVINGSQPVARADAMYTLQMLRTNDALYLGFHARDDKLMADSGDAVEKDDALRFSVDSDQDNVADPTDHFYRVRWDGKGNDNGRPIDALTVYTATVPTGWNMEIRIPAAALNIPLGSNSFKFTWGVGDDDNGGGLDHFLLWAGAQVDTPDASWPVASLDGPSFTPPGLLEAGRWEWHGGGPLFAIAAGAGANVWAGGNGVWKTTNNGSNWNHLPLLVNAEIRGVRFWDAYRGLAHTDRRVYFTEDGGATWRLGYDAGNSTIQKLVAAGSDTAWLVARLHDAYGALLHDAIFRSRDGGATWQHSLNTGETNSLDLAAHGADRAWLLYDEGSESCGSLLYRTVDGGANWISSCIADAGGQISAQLLAFADPLTGWLAGTQGNGSVQPWRTMDGGDTWQKQGLGVESLSWLTAVDATNAWLTSGNQIYRTTDGSTWNKLGDGAPDRAAFRNASEGWGLKGRSIVRTTNGGATWNTSYTPPDAPLERWWDHLHGWRIRGSAVERTTDGGGTWTSVPTGMPAVDHLQFVDSLNGWAWHDASLGLRRTSDGGATWKTQTTGSDALLDLQFVSAAHGWVLDSANNLRRTTDGGLTWHLVTAPPMPDPVPGPSNSFNLSLYFVNANVGMAGVARYAGSSDCASFYSRTTDGGTTWTPLQDGPSALYTFGTGQIGWSAAGCATDDRGSSRLYKTTTGGASWFELDHPEFAHEDLHAQDADQLFAFGSGAPVDKSSDGGASFQSQRAEDGQLGADSRLDRIFHEEGDPTTARLAYRNTEIPAYQANIAPKIDGNLDDWTRPRQVSLKATTAQTAQGGNPTPLASSAVLRAAWDASNLYLALRVYDDEIHVDTPEQPWRDDGVEFALDPAHDHIAAAPDDDRQYLVRADGSQYLWGAATSQLQVARRDLSDGYALEVRIPRSQVPALNPTAGKVIGFNFSVIDDVDGGDAETRLFWTGKRTSTAQANWGQLRFSAIDAEFQPGGGPTPTPTVTPTPTPTTTPVASGGAIGGKVWHDANGNRQIDDGEPGLVNVTIDLYSDATQIGQEKTDGQGSYLFAGLPPGSYTVKEKQPSWFLRSTTPDEVSVTVGHEPVVVNFGDWNGTHSYLPMILR